MPSSIPRKRSKPRLLLSVLTVAAVTATAPALAVSGTISPAVSPAPAAGFLTSPATEPVRLRVAQSQEAAQLQLRIQQLEEQIRVLTGQVEGLQFQMAQMQTLIERTNEDNEFRFQALEGGGPGKPPAATESGGVMPAEELPQTQPDAATAQPEEPARLEPEDGEPMHSTGDSQDPLIGGSAAGGTLGTLSDDDASTLDGTRPLDLSLDGGTAVSNGDAQAQYEAGYEAIVRGDYAFAEDQFQQFVALYPDDPQAPDATHWLGEALIQRGAYDDAALVLAEGYQQYQSSSRAPDLLLKLGIALHGAGEAEVACRTYATLEQRHASVSEAFRQRLNEEKQRAQCPGG